MTKEDELNKWYTENGYKTEDETKELEKLYFDDLGMCGCGRPDDIKSMLVAIMEAQVLKRDGEGVDNYRKYEIIQHEALKPEIVLDFIIHVLDDSGFMEHGGCAVNGWLTDKGKRFIELLKLK